MLLKNSFIKLNSLSNVGSNVQWILNHWPESKHKQRLSLKLVTGCHTVTMWDEWVKDSNRDSGCESNRFSINIRPSTVAVHAGGCSLQTLEFV